MNPNPLTDFPAASSWSLWTGTAGKSLVLFGLGLFLLSILLGLLSKKREGFERLSRIAFTLGSLTVFGTMACLITLFVGNQFQFEYVFGHASAETDLKYKIAGVWSGQEGSFLLWACSSALFGLLATRGAGVYRRSLTLVFSAFLGALCGILAYETPFNLLEGITVHGRVLMPPYGNGMVPSLQNYWVVIHPPTIFLGFGSLAVLFAYAAAAMMTGNVTDWARRARPWCLLSLAILGLGICMGGLWAYETLGWGGFWMWDPVENASLVPWIFTAALTHGLIVQVAKGKRTGVNLILAGLPFLTFLYGTFLTRSGFLSDVSVHSFAEMDRSALQVLLGLLVFSVVGFGGLYLWRGRKLTKFAEASVSEEAPGLQREALYRWSVLMLSLLGLGVAVGMSWPFFMALSGRKAAVVEEGLYHKVVVWFFLPLMLLMAVAPFVSWRPIGIRALLTRIVNVFSVTFGLLGVSLFFLKNPFWGAAAQQDVKVPMPFGMQVALLPWMLILLFLCLFVAVANFWRIVEIWRRSRPSIGGFVAHIGMAMLLCGLILSRGFERKEELMVREGRPERALDYVVQFKGLTDPTLQDRDGKALFDVIGRESSFTARPGLYYHKQNDEEKPMVWPHVERGATHDVYFALGEPQTLVWQGAETFKVGETRTIHEMTDITVTYLGLEREGEAGIRGTSFGAKLKVRIDDHEHEVTPKMILGGDRDMPQIDEDFRMMMVGMDAADKSVQLQLLWATPLYPVTIYYKPMTSLVWLGMGVMTLGGLIAARARRRRDVPATAPLDPAQEETPPAGEFGTNAPVPTT